MFLQPARYSHYSLTECSPSYEKCTECFKKQECERKKIYRENNKDYHKLFVKCYHKLFDMNLLINIINNKNYDYKKIVFTKNLRLSDLNFCNYNLIKNNKVITKIIKIPKIYITKLQNQINDGLYVSKLDILIANISNEYLNKTKKK
jgi:hypothetical protein